MTNYRDAKYQIPASGITTGTFANARISSGSVTQHVTATDLTPVRQDVLTLALKQAVEENHTKYNLPNSSIVKFEADADFNLAGSTNISRNDSEYISSTSVSTAQFTNDGNTKLLLHFDGSNDSTTFTDSSSSSHSPTAGGSAHLDTAIKKIGTASLQLDGSGDYIDVPASSDFAYSTGDWTIETWAYFTSGSIGPRKVIVFNGTHDQANEIWIHTNSSVDYLGYEIRNSSNTRWSPTATTPAFVADTWYHIAVTRDGSTLRHYIDGVQAEAHGTSLTGSFGHGSSTFRIGKRNDNESIEGYLDEFRVSDTCRYPNGTTFVPNQLVTVSATGTALGTTNVPTSAVTDVSGVMLLKNASGTATFGSGNDIIVSYTCDNSNWTAVTDYTDAGTFSTGIKMIKLGKKTCTSGSDVRWKIEWANQSGGSLETQIYGIGLNY